MTPSCCISAHCRHNATDIIDIIREWRRPKHTARLKAISAAASEFSRRWGAAVRMVWHVRACPLTCVAQL